MVKRGRPPGTTRVLQKPPNPPDRRKIQRTTLAQEKVIRDDLARGTFTLKKLLYYLNTHGGASAMALATGLEYNFVRSWRRPDRKIDFEEKYRIFLEAWRKSQCLSSSE
jgi:hypothetical protein